MPEVLRLPGLHGRAGGIVSNFTTYRRATDEDRERLNTAARKFLKDYFPDQRRLLDGEVENPEWEVIYRIGNSGAPAYYRSIWNRRKARALRLRGAREGYGIAYGYVGRWISESA